MPTRSKSLSEGRWYGDLHMAPAALTEALRARKGHIHPYEGSLAELAGLH